MKKLSLIKTDLGGGYRRYEVMEDGQVIATRTARREYIAAIIIRPGYYTETGFKIEKMFGRQDLFEKAIRNIPTDMKYLNVYGIAELTLEML